MPTHLYKVIPTDGKNEEATAKGATRVFHNLRAVQLFPRAGAERFNGRLSIFPRTQWLWSAGLTRRLAFKSTSMESGRAFQKSSRMRPSEICVTVAGMALAVTTQPTRTTTAL